METLTVKIEVYNAERGWHTPDILIEGERYPVSVLITTTEAIDFTVLLTGLIEGTPLFQVGPVPGHLDATAPWTLEGVSFGVPSETAGKTGVLITEVFDLTGNIIAETQVPITIQSLPAPAGCLPAVAAGILLVAGIIASIIIAFA